MMKLHGMKRKGITVKQIDLGGFEGGMTTWNADCRSWCDEANSNIIQAFKSVDIDTKEAFQASVERSDSCAVPAASCCCRSCCRMGISVQPLLNNSLPTDLNN